jgi:KRAB domain-containing zinc finger protein
MSRNTVVNKVEKVALEMKINLKTSLSGIEFIATTTDCWTAYRRGFLGVTAHWIDPQTMKRCCAALACKQLKGSHSFSALASALNEIHTEFNIRDKITRTTTDNGSNFLKAFRLYGQTNENINNPAPTAASGEEDDDGGEDENNEDQDSVEFVEAGAILDEDDCLEYQLPKHHRCACHLLNLVATVDVEEANVSTVYKRVSRSTFSKYWSLWNKSARSTTAAEIIEENCKLQLLRPNATRWNSLFLAVERIVRIAREQGEGAITAVCSALKIPMYVPACIYIFKAELYIFHFELKSY